MDPEEILELVAGGDLDPEDIDDFQSLDDSIQQMVADGNISVEDALSMK